MKLPADWSIPAEEPVPCTILQALFNDMLRFFVAQIMIFTFFIAPSMIPKGIVWTMENLSKPLDRAHRVVLRTRMERLENAPQRITGEITRTSW
jgi:hypothetical protein